MPEAEAKVLEFLSELQAVRRAHDILPELIANFDESGLFFDQIPSYTCEKKEIKHSGLKCPNFYKKKMTVGLAISAAGDIDLVSSRSPWLN